MDAAEWMARFKAVHTKAKGGPLEPGEKKRYDEMREELARSMCAGQNIVLQPGESGRKKFSVAQLYEVEISNIYKTMTRELSMSHFAGTIAKGLKLGDAVTFVISPGRDQPKIEGRGTVTAATNQGGSLRVVVTFEELSAQPAERLETLLFDAVLSRIK